MIDIDAVWKELGYSRKDYLVAHLKNRYVEDKDYQALQDSNGNIGRPKIKIFLSNECYQEIKNRVYHQTKNIYREKVYRASLYKEVGGFKDVSTPIGSIDILTDREVIEVKSAKEWRCGLGQLLAYAYFYPSKSKRLHLFGESDSRELIEKICRKSKVYVTWAS